VFLKSNEYSVNNETAYPYWQIQQEKYFTVKVVKRGSKNIYI